MEKGEIVKVVLDYVRGKDGHAHIVVSGVFSRNASIPVRGPNVVNRNVVSVFTELEMSIPAFDLGEMPEDIDAL